MVRGEGNRFEDAANEFATWNVQALKDCLEETDVPDEAPRPKNRVRCR